jgi:hypothetical protein
VGQLQSFLSRFEEWKHARKKRSGSASGLCQFEKIEHALATENTQTKLASFTVGYEAHRIHLPLPSDLGRKAVKLLFR